MCPSQASEAGAPSLTFDSDALAADYEKLSATYQLESGKRLAIDLGIGAGERVLDVGCGTGLLAEHVADLVGPEGRVLGIDPLPLRIEVAGAKARANLALATSMRNGNGSMPSTRPLGPTRSAMCSASRPVPQPTSSTRSPAPMPRSMASRLPDSNWYVALSFS